MLLNLAFATFFICIAVYFFITAYRSKNFLHPLRIDIHDPDYQSATSLARNTLDIFEKLRLKYPQGAAAYLGPFSADGTTYPYIVRDVHGDDTYTLVVPDQTGVTAAPQRCKKSDIIDWSVFETAEKLHGAFLLRTVLRKNNRPVKSRNLFGLSFIPLDMSRKKAGE